MQSVPAPYAVWPLIVSIAAKLGLVLVKHRHGRKIGSSSLLADATNDGIDMLSGTVALGRFVSDAPQSRSVSCARTITALLPSD